jgi:hypothetical protein
MTITNLTSQQNTLIKQQQMEKYMLNRHTLSHLSRDKLVTITKKIGINKNMNSPYQRKDDIIRIIESKTIKKSKTKRDKIKSKLSNTGTWGTQRGGLSKQLSLQTLSQLKKSLPYRINFDNLELDLKDHYDKVDKLYVLGDVHGDLMATLESLKLAKLITVDCNPLKVDNQRLIHHVNWSGGKSFLVQIGDQIDRTRPESWNTNQITNDNAYHDEGSDLKIMELFDKLAYQAQKAGGCVISLLGNHELMNVAGDFRYVSTQEFKEFGNRFNEQFKHLSYNKSSGFPYGYWERKFVFKPGGIIAKRMGRNRKAAVQIGKWIFVHGGFVPESALKYSIKDMNHIVKMHLLGSKDPIIKRKYNDLFYNDDNDFSPFWSRKFGYPEEDDKGSFLKTIQALNYKNNNTHTENIKGMVIGHTPQFFNDKSINSSFNDHLWRVDVGMSRAFGPRNNKGNNVFRNISLLYIKNNDIVSIVGNT